MTWVFHRKGTIVTNSRSRLVRKLMTQTGMSYARAARELDRRKALSKSPMQRIIEQLTATGAMANAMAPHRRMFEQLKTVTVEAD